jgi:hypothetical protein
MKYIITESRLNNAIEKYIHIKYPTLDFNITQKEVTLKTPNENGETNIIRNIIVMNSDNFILKVVIRNDLNKMFGINVGRPGSYWDITSIPL